MQLEAAIFDLGNVLVGVDFRRGAQRLAGLTRCPPEEALAALTGQALLELDAGRITPAQFFQGLQRRLGTRLSDAELRACWNDIFEIDGGMLALAERLLPTLRIHLWSNTDPIHWAYLYPRMPLLGRFHGLHLSFELGASKPEPLFYERAIDQAGLAPERSVFIDDLERNLAPARALGLHTIQHVGLATTAARLAALGVPS